MKFPEEYRFNGNYPYVSQVGDTFGCFSIPAHVAPGRRVLTVIANDATDTGWDHVSVSLGRFCKQTPTWPEMAFVKRLFWDDSECVVQFYPAEEDYVNNHPGVLHWWCWKGGKFPMPPKICV